MATLLKPNGLKVEVEPANAKRGFQLSELKEVLFENDESCGTGRKWIEIVHLPNGMRLVVDEEGWLRETQYPNLRASRIAGQPIEGPALLCTRQELQ